MVSIIKLVLIKYIITRVLMEADSCCLQAETANKGAQKLYESLGYEKDIGYFKDLIEK